LKPVRGSAPLAVDDEEGVAVDEADAVGDELVDDAVAVAGAVWLEPELELDGVVEAPFDWEFEPASGSVYCWSPADGPVASATGASSIRPTTTTRK
jgi:hypothetical protein